MSFVIPRSDLDSLYVECAKVNAYVCGSLLLTLECHSATKHFDVWKWVLSDSGFTRFLQITNRLMSRHGFFSCLFYCVVKSSGNVKVAAQCLVKRLREYTDCPVRKRVCTYLQHWCIKPLGMCLLGQGSVELVRRTVK